MSNPPVASTFEGYTNYPSCSSSSSSSSSFSSFPTATSSALLPSSSPSLTASATHQSTDAISASISSYSSDAAWPPASAPIGSSDAPLPVAEPLTIFRSLLQSLSNQKDGLMPRTNGTFTDDWLTSASSYLYLADEVLAFISPCPYPEGLVPAMKTQLQYLRRRMQEFPLMGESERDCFQRLFVLACLGLIAKLKMVTFCWTFVELKREEAHAVGTYFPAPVPGQHSVSSYPSAPVNSAPPPTNTSAAAVSSFPPLQPWALFNPSPPILLQDQQGSLNASAATSLLGIAPDEMQQHAFQFDQIAWGEALSSAPQQPQQLLQQQLQQQQLLQQQQQLQQQQLQQQQLQQQQQQQQLLLQQQIPVEHETLFAPAAIQASGARPCDEAKPLTKATATPCDSSAPLSASEAADAISYTIMQQDYDGPS
eukprot:GHVT01088444.1.p1 GENE.GHVT01088444.1~~GHVT01088444.1.p1  ORF type:complete len:424 (-),score=141.87 GHVT01088444.1:180-1451(-)